MSLSTVVLFSVVPAIQVTRVSPGLAVKGQGSQTLGGHGMARFRTALATTQIAFSMVLLVLAGLFTQSLVNVARVDLGMNVDSVVTFTVSPRMNGRDAADSMAIFDRIEERLAAEPGVASVGSARIALLTRRGSTSNPAFEGAEIVPGADGRVLTNDVSPGFFTTLAVPVLTGRTFAAADELGAPRVAVVNESLVRKFDLGPAPVGKRFSLGPIRSNIEIVGVVADAQYRSVKDDVPAQIFLPRRQNDNLDGVTFYVRGVDSDALQRTIPRAVAEIEPELAVGELGTFEGQVQENVYLDTLVATLSAGFAALATLLGAFGLYSVLAYNVTQRIRELGLRLALGATPREVCALGVQAGRDDGVDRRHNGPHRGDRTRPRRRSVAIRLVWLRTLGIDRGHRRTGGGRVGRGLSAGATRVAHCTHGSVALRLAKHYAAGAAGRRLRCASCMHCLYFMHAVHHTPYSACRGRCSPRARACNREELERSGRRCSGRRCGRYRGASEAARFERHSGHVESRQGGGCSAHRPGPYR